jgi:hypothetical protein
MKRRNQGRVPNGGNAPSAKTASISLKYDRCGFMLARKAPFPELEMMLS